MVFDKLLNGSGNVSRALLRYNDLMSGASAAPVDDSAFALPAEASMLTHVFEGYLEIFAEADNGGFQKIRDDNNYSANNERLHIPKFKYEFVQDGIYLIPVTQDLSLTGHPYWNYIIAPGRIWQENGDNGYSCTSFPFALVERNANCTHNGVMTFLFNGTSVSDVRYQITQETCVYFKFNIWGQLKAIYKPETISNAATLKTNHAAEVDNRLPTKLISALATDFPNSGVRISKFGSGVTPEHMTTYGLVINGTNYASGCGTRYGQYA